MAFFEPTFSDAAWFKSSFSDKDGGNCVEVAFSGGHVGVRDSKQHGTGPVLVVTVPGWVAFLDLVRASDPA